MFAPPTGDRVRDIFGFQAANIQATLLLLRMLFLSIDDNGRSPSDVQLKCNVAAELLAVFRSIPSAYLCGISTPLIYHLAGIGMILGSVMEGPLSEAGYQKVRENLLSIADLLESLESGLSRAADISKDLRTLVERIDDYMRLQRQRMGKSFAQTQPSHGPSVNPVGVPIQQQHLAPTENVGMHVASAGNNEAGTQASGRDGVSIAAGGDYNNEWLGEFQLPPELLEDWPWPFNLQSENWSFLGLDQV